MIGSPPHTSIYSSPVTFLLPYAHDYTISLDDSGTHTQSAFACLAGFLGKTQRFQKLTEEWRATLNRYDLRDFHSKEFGKLAALDGWSEDDVKEAYNSFHEVVERHAVPIGSYVNLPAYRAFADTPYRQKTLGSPLLLATKGILINTEKWAKSVGYGGPISFLFDRGIKGLGSVKNHLRSVSKHEEKHGLSFKIGAIGDDSVSSSPSLQAADCLAHKLFQSCGYMASGNEPTFERRGDWASRDLISRFGREHTYADGFDDERAMRAYLDDIKSRGGRL